MKIKNKLRTLITFIVMLVFVSLLSGCQLAKEAYSTAENSDQLCGVFVTIGTDALQVVETSLGSLTLNDNGVPFFDKVNFGLENGNKVEGVVNEDGSAEFEGVDGYYMGFVYEFNKQGKEISKCGLACKEFQDRRYSVVVNENSKEDNCKATLYVTAGFKNIIHLNPVYHRADGTYYTVIVIGQQMGFMFNGSEIGSVYTQSINKSYSTTTNGKTHTEKYNYEVHFSVENEVEKVLIKEMNQNDECIKTTEYDRNDVEKFIVDSKANYVIVEEYVKINSKKNEVKRSIYSLDKKKTADKTVSHSCYYPGDNGVMNVKSITFSYK